MARVIRPRRRKPVTMVSARQRPGGARRHGLPITGYHPVLVRDETPGAKSAMIRSLGPDDWQVLRDVRLRALADAPLAFSATYAQESAQPDSFWREGASSPHAAVFAALVDGRPVGVVRVHRAPADAPAARLVAMWVDPAARGRGIGRALVERVVAWVREQRAAQLQLWVTESNAAAIRLYQACGFAFTGEREPFPPQPSLCKLSMQLSP
jgi:ribosomal protein S18 acetylase RimI-like enzyme